MSPDVATDGEQLLVFTDLDGSLMEHETYSIEPARPALAELQRRGYLLVMNSSKTAAEMLAVQRRLKLKAPFICENGAALELLEPIDGQQSIVFGKPREQWLPQVQELRQAGDYRFEGFADWNPVQIAELTGLSRSEAELAAKRQYSEPISWRDSTQKRERFVERLAELGLQMLEGGRFFSIQGWHDKSNAMDWLRQHQASSSSIITVALGDSPNDSAMLEAADVAVVIKSGKSSRIELSSPQQVVHTSRPGPAGWQDAMTKILDWLDKGELAQP